jgi:hypothetical protein
MQDQEICEASQEFAPKVYQNSAPPRLATRCNLLPGSFTRFLSCVRRDSRWWQQKDPALEKSAGPKKSDNI